MSLPISSTGAAAVLPALSSHSHGHGHKKGLDALTDPTDATTSTASQPAGSTQNLFSSLLTSVEQVIGTQPAARTSQIASAGKPAAVGQTNTQVAPATSAFGDAAKALLGTVGTALKLFA